MGQIFWLIKNCPAFVLFSSKLKLFFSVTVYFVLTVGGLVSVLSVQLPVVATRCRCRAR